MPIRWPTGAPLRGVILLFMLATPSRMLSAGIAHPMDAMLESNAIVANVQVSHDHFVGHIEPSLAVNPRDPNRLLGAAQLHAERPPTILGTFVSSDGGRTWRDNGPLPLPPGTNFGTDVTVAFDARGIGFVAAAAAAYTPGVGVSRVTGVYVWRTDDGGRSFYRPVVVARGPLLDHPWLAIDAAPGGTDDLYLAWAARAGLAFSRSIDGGRHFSTPRIISTPTGDVPVVAAGRAGAVYVAYEPNAGQTGLREIAVLKSVDHGQSFGRPVVLGQLPDLLTPGPGLRLPTGPSVATDPRTGMAYVAYAAYHAGTSRMDILVARLRDGGHNWSVPVPVTDNPYPGPTAAFQPQVVVDAAGAVDVTYFALAHGRIAVFLARSTMQGVRFEPPRRVSSQSFNPMQGGSVGGGEKAGALGLWWIGDYQGLATGGGMIHPFWNDTRTGRLEIFTTAIAVSAV